MIEPPRLLPSPMVFSSDEENENQPKANDELPQSANGIPRFKIVKKKKRIISQVGSSNDRTAGLYASSGS
jgi:hypothetical protein